eukprot:s1818_g19.t3
MSLNFLIVLVLVSFCIVLADVIRSGNQQGQRGNPYDGPAGFRQATSESPESSTGPEGPKPEALSATVWLMAMASNSSMLRDRNPCSLNGTRHGSGRGRQSPAILAVGVFMPLADAYDTLGLPRSCSDEEVKQAYRALALKNHPDKVQDETKRHLATTRFQEIQAAYETIIDTRTRTVSLAAVAPASRTPLMAACERGDLALASSLLAADADLMAQDATGRSAILFAASAANLQVLTLLLEHAADVNSSNCAGHTCVMYAVGAGMQDISKAAQRLDVVRLLLDEGATANGTTGYGLSALMLASASGRVEMIELLVQRAAEINAATDIGLTALTMAADKGHVDAVKFLLRSTASADHRYSNDKTALMGAAALAHTAVVIALLEGRAEVNARSGDGQSPLLYAVESGLKDGLVCPVPGEVHKPGAEATTTALLHAAADPNIAGPRHRTALHISVACGSVKLASLLLSARASLDALDEDGRSAMDIAQPGFFDSVEASAAGKHWLKMLGEICQVCAGASCFGCAENARTSAGHDFIAGRTLSRFSCPSELIPPQTSHERSAKGMRLHVLQTQGIPPNSILSVRSGSSRRQQLIPCQAPFKLEQPPVPVELDVLTCRAKGHEVCSPGPCEQLLKVPMSNGGKSMSVTFRVRKVDGEDEQESCHTPKLGRKDKEAAIEAYLLKHDLHSFMKEVFQGLTAEQPEDPFLYIGRCLQAAAARDVGCKDFPPKSPPAQPSDEERGPVLKGASRSIAREQQGSTMQRLRRKARDTLSKGYLDGRLHSTLCSLPEEHEADLLLQTSREPGTAPVQQRRAEATTQLGSCEEPSAASGHPVNAAQQSSAAEASLSSSQRLRRKARDALSKGYLDGRLQSALHGFADESEADTLLPSSQEPGVAPAPTVSPAQQRRAEADAPRISPSSAEEAQQHVAEAALSPAQRMPPSSAEAGVAPAAAVNPVPQHSPQVDVMPPSEAGVAPAAAVSPVPQHSPQADVMWPSSAEAGVAPAAAVSPEVMRVSSPSPAVTPSPSPDQALQSGQVAPFSALPAASAWVLTDAEGDDTHLDTPRLSRFAPSTFRRKPSAHSESSVVSEDLLDFMPDRSSWLLNENKDLQPSVVQGSMASRWSHRSLAAEKQALQAMLAEFTPRISDFIPSKELPCLQSELLHLRPDERLPSTNDFTLDQVADPDLQAFVPLPYDPGRSGVLANRPPRELLWSEGSSDGVATPRLTQFMPCYPGVRS